MRKLTYSIGLLFICVLISFGFYFSYNRTDSKKDSLDYAIEAEHMISPEFHIGVHENKIIVYLQNGSVYETTDIIWDQLPKVLQDKIVEGFVIYSVQELYNFLEAYSS